VEAIPPTCLFEFIFGSYRQTSSIRIEFILYFDFSFGSVSTTTTTTTATTVTTMSVNHAPQSLPSFAQAFSSSSLSSIPNSNNALPPIQPRTHHTISPSRQPSIEQLRNSRKRSREDVVIRCESTDDSGYVNSLFSYPFSIKIIAASHLESLESRRKMTLMIVSSILLPLLKSLLLLSSHRHKRNDE
jgi:hypothetical protein